MSDTEESNLNLMTGDVSEDGIPAAEGTEEELPSPQREAVKPIHAQALASTLYNLYKDGIATDINVVCQDETFQLHSSVLIHGSQYFHSLLTEHSSSNNNENDAFYEASQQQNSKKTITLEFNPPIDSQTFHIVIESLYTGIVHPITSQNVTTLLSAYYHLQIHYAYDTCVQYMLQQINMDNCLTYWLAGKFCQSDEVKKKAIGYMGRHLDTFYPTMEFLELQKFTVMEILNDDELQVPNEKVVFEAAMAWMKYEDESIHGSSSSNSRAADISDMMDVIRMTYLPAFYLVNVVGKEDLIENDRDAMIKYSKALKLKLANKHGEKTKRYHYVHGMISSFEKAQKQSKVKVSNMNCGSFVEDMKNRILSPCQGKGDDNDDEDDEDDNIIDHLEFEEDEDGNNINNNSRSLLSELSLEEPKENQVKTFTQGFFDQFRKSSVREEILVVKTNNDDHDPVNDTEHPATGEKKNFIQGFFDSLKMNNAKALQAKLAQENDTAAATDDTDDTENSSEEGGGFQENFTISYKRLEGVPEECDEDLSDGHSSKFESNSCLSFSNEEVNLSKDVKEPEDDVGEDEKSDKFSHGDLINMEIPQDTRIPKVETDDDSFC